MTGKGAIACGHPLTARAAADVLADGGNAFDAALAALVAACVAEPVLASLGGGGFLIARPASGREVVFDFFPQTPRRRVEAADAAFFPVLADFGPVQQEFHVGIGAMATPGMVGGLFAVHERFGTLPMRRIVEAAVAWAREGVRVEPMQAYMCGVVAAILESDPGCRALFASPEQPDRLIGEGEILRNPALADTLETLAIEGAALFYRGEIARAIASDCASRGGHLCRADLEGYEAVLRRPLVVDALAGRLLLNPPPASGGVLLAFALEMLGDGDLGALGWGSAAAVERLMRVMEATNRARIESRLHEQSAEDAAEALLAPALIAAFRAGVLGHPPANRGTTHISVIDRAGNAAALSLSNGEGSGYVVPGTGIHMNNVLGEADINPHGFHRWPTNTRISSMMAPTLVLNPTGGTTVLGSGGSNRIRTAILQVLVNARAFALPLPEAIERPRLHYEGGRLSLEHGFREDAVAAGRRIASEVDLFPSLNMFFGGVHAVESSRSGALRAAGDPRRAGVGLVV